MTDRLQTRCKISVEATANGEMVSDTFSVTVNEITSVGEYLVGGEEADVLNGTEEDDSLFGGKGDDTISGGEGSDVFVLESDSGQDLISDFADGIDRIGLTRGIVFEDLTITGSNNTQIIDSNDNILMVLSEVNANTITAEDFITL